MGSATKWLRKLVLKIALIASNLLFFSVASWILVTGSNLRKAGWLDVFEDQYPWFHGVYVFIVIFLSLLVATMAVTGLYTLLYRRKEYVLYIYATCTILSTLLFVAFTIEAVSAWRTARTWSTRRMIDPTVEQEMQDNFNAVYCRSEAAYLCTAPATAQWLVHFGSDDLRDLFLAPPLAKTIKQAMTMERSRSSRNFIQLCEDESSVLHVPVMDRTVASFCTWCGQVADLRSYVHIVQWANTKCPPQQASAKFCVQSIWSTMTEFPFEGVNMPLTDPRLLNSTTPVINTAPYAQCRKPFLSYWSYFALWFLVLSVVMLAFMTGVMRMAWLVFKPKPEKYSARQGKKPERRPLVPVTSTSKDRSK